MIPQEQLIANPQETTAKILVPANNANRDLKEHVVEMVQALEHQNQRIIELNGKVEEMRRRLKKNADNSDIDDQARRIAQIYLDRLTELFPKPKE
jgi:predicted nuclease with TOPRIM domain